jgi:nitrate reductase NapAB chaperone NapD
MFRIFFAFPEERQKESSQIHRFPIKEIWMPIFSYLAYPVKGAKEVLFNDLKALDHCEVMPAENEEILILVTDTPDEESEEELQKRLNTLKSLQSLGMTFGHADE